MTGMKQKTEKKAKKKKKERQIPKRRTGTKKREELRALQNQVRFGETPAKINSVSC